MPEVIAIAITASGTAIVIVRFTVHVMVMCKLMLIERKILLVTRIAILIEIGFVMDLRRAIVTLRPFWGFGWAW